MENIVGINNNLLVKCTLMRPDGEPFPLNECVCRVFITSARGRSEVKDYSISGTDKNVVSWETNIPSMHALGRCSILIEILRKGRQIAKVEDKDAFRITSGPAYGREGAQRLSRFLFVNVLHADEVPGAVNVIYPKLEVDEGMHLRLKGDTERFEHNFSLGEDGHLLFHND